MTWLEIYAFVAPAIIAALYIGGGFWLNRHN